MKTKTRNTINIWTLIASLLVFILLVGASLANADVYIDNGDPGSSSTGTWLNSGGANSYGSTSLYARPEATYTWQFDSQPAADYEVLMWWTTTDTRGSSVNGEIVSSNGTIPFTINQLIDGGQWNSLGIYSFDGSGSISITASDEILLDGRFVSTCADAVWLRQVSGNTPPQASIVSITPNPALPGAMVSFSGLGTDDGTVEEYHWSSNLQGELSSAASFSVSNLVEGVHEISFYVVDNEGVPSTTEHQILTIAKPTIVVDNGDADSSSTGTWANSSGPNSYGTTSVYARPPATYTWQFDSQPAGLYEVLIWWTTTSTRGSDIHGEIISSNGIYPFISNQQIDGGQWNSLGTFAFNGSGSVEITASDSLLPDGRIVSTSADAVQFRYIGVLPSNIDNDEDGYTSDVDCDDTNPLINPGATEVCDGIDNNCDGIIDEGFDLDGDGISSCGGDCNDNNADIFPGNTESCDGLDNNCDGQTDNVADLDGDGFTICNGECNDTDPTIYPGANEVCDGVDNNCNGSIDEGFDLDGDSYTTCAGDCNDGDSTIYPGATEICEDGIDQDCNGVDLTCAPPDDIVIDNGELNTSSTGTWSVSGGENSYGTISIFARPEATYTWQLDDAQPGVYEVFMYWTWASTRGANIATNVLSRDGIDTVYINQQQNAGQWNSIGTYSFNGSGSVTVNASNEVLDDGRTVSTCADAVLFRYVSDLQNITEPPTAEFSANNTIGAAPYLVQFTDLSSNEASSWSWDFGDGASSTEQNPSHEYAAIGTYTVTLTASNSYGSGTIVKESFIQVVAAYENIYIIDGFGTTTPLFQFVTAEVSAMGGTENSPGVWSYTNTDKGVTYFIRDASSVAAAQAAFAEEGSHIIYGGHSNYGLGMTFVEDTDLLRYFDDNLFLNTSTDTADAIISGIRYGQPYNNWLPVYQNGYSAIAPYDFSEGTPPYNYYLTYQLPGDPIHYLQEKRDGSYWQRFPDSNTPAWYSPDGSSPDPIDNPEYFITNPDPDFNRTEFVGTWSRISTSLDDNLGYLGQNYHEHQPGAGNNKAIWTFMVRDPGLYAVLGSWQPNSDNASNAVYTIHHSGLTGSTPTDIQVDQRVTAGLNMLGVYYFNYGTNTIELSDLADGTVIADAIALQPLDNPAHLLQSEFRANIVSGAGPLSVQFTDLTSVYGTDLTAWEWDFGDGSLSTEQNPSHTYSSPGSYTVTLSVTDATEAQSIEVKEDFITVGVEQILRAEFAAEKSYGFMQTAIQFFDQSSGNMTTWEWDFGDGVTSNERNPWHAYRSAGTYTVTLTVADEFGTDMRVKSDYVHNLVGMIAIDNVFEYKAHYYSTYRGYSVGKTIMDAKEATIPDEELKYSRLFYNSCFTGKYYSGKFNHGILFYTHANSREPRPEALYIRSYLEGLTDDQILTKLNELNYEIYDYDEGGLPYGLYDYYDFTKLPPSMR